MAPSGQEFSSCLKATKRRVAFGALALFCVSFAASAISAQSSQVAAFSKSEPEALAIVGRAAIALGGAGNWRSFGAATASISISRSVGPAETVQLSHDWHLGHLLSRADSTNKNGRRANIITLKDQRSRTIAGGTAHAIPHENDVAVLAKVNPGAALTLSLDQNICVFKMISATNLSDAAKAREASVETVEEDCTDPFMPFSPRLTWTFSNSTGLPIQVEIPVRDMLHDSVFYETATFVQFSDKSGLLLPSEMTITLPSGQIERYSIAQWSLTSSLPGNTFTTTH